MKVSTRIKFKRKLKILTFCLAAILLSNSNILAQKPKAASPPTKQIKTVTVMTEPNAEIWLDDVKRGTTDESGKLAVKNVSAGKHILRVRADGFKEVSQNLLPAQTGDVKIGLVKTTDEAELAFQQAEKLQILSKEKSKELYQKAISLRPKFAEAHLGLARVLMEQSDVQGALEAVKNARKARLGYAEASAVEGRIYKLDEQEDKAIASYKRAIVEGKGIQPEAYTGLALFYKEKAEAAGADGDFENEQVFYAQSLKYFPSAISQLSGAPDAMTVYQLFGLVYEKMKKYQDAIRVYEEFLRVFPDTSEASVVRSFIVQLKKQMNEQQ
jgi:tetratricopeptide (TPR) repeat protein